MTWRFLVGQLNSNLVLGRSWYCETKRDGSLLWSSTSLPCQRLITCIRRSIPLQASPSSNGRILEVRLGFAPQWSWEAAISSSYWRFNFCSWWHSTHSARAHMHTHTLVCLKMGYPLGIPPHGHLIGKMMINHWIWDIPYFQNPHTRTKHACRHAGM